MKGRLPLPSSATDGAELASLEIAPDSVTFEFLADPAVLAVHHMLGLRAGEQRHGGEGSEEAGEGGRPLLVGPPEQEESYNFILVFC
jgi:hypothetical protein